MTLWIRTPSPDFPDFHFEDLFACKMCGTGRPFSSYTLGHIVMDGPDDMEKLARIKEGTWPCHNCCLYDPYFKRFKNDISSGWSACRSKRDPDLFGCFVCRKKLHWTQYTWNDFVQLTSAEDLLECIDNLGQRWCCNQCFDRKAF